MMEQGEDYHEMLEAIETAAQRANASLAEMRLNLDFPEVMDW